MTIIKCKCGARVKEENAIRHIALVHKEPGSIELYEQIKQAEKLNKQIDDWHLALFGITMSERLRLNDKI